MNNVPIAHFRQSDKSPQQLQNHLLATSELCGELTEKIGLREVGQVLGLLHDIGKLNPEFQNYLHSAVGMINPDEDDYIDPSSMKGRIDHSTLGAQIAFEKLWPKDEKGQISAQIIALCLASHHSGLIDCLSPEGVNKFQERMNKNISHTALPISNLDEFSDRLQSLWSLNIEEKLFLKVDSIQEKGFDSSETLYFKHGLLIRFLLSCLLDADRIDSADFEFSKNIELRNRGKYPQWDVLNTRLNQRLKEFEENKDKNEVDHLRKKVSQDCFKAAHKAQGIFQLTVPTGGGKTLASLRFAVNHAAHHKLDRVFIIIPYTSIIDQNAREIREILEDRDGSGEYCNDVVLEHHSNLTPEKQNYRQSLLSQNWDAPIVLTTQVQFLEALFGPSTRSARRMHQLAKAVIIFDEIQTLPFRCINMFNVALRFLVHDCHSSVVLCTATQPLLDKVTPPERALNIPFDFHIVSDEESLFKKIKRVETFDERKPGGWETPDVADLALNRLNEKGSVLIVVNTRRSARELYQALARRLPWDVVYHLSTNMCPAHRLAILDVVKGKLDQHFPVICVSTQLIEAGVDIDFGAVIRYLAGLDSISQTAGRCNRHGRQVDSNGNRIFGSVAIINPAKERLTRLQDIKTAGDVSQRILDDYNVDPALFGNDRLGLRGIDQFYQYYFFMRQGEMDYQVGPESCIGRGDNLFNVLSTNTDSLAEYCRRNKQRPEMRYLQSFESASRAFKVIDSSTQGVIVPYGEGGVQLIKKFRSAKDLPSQWLLMRKAQRYSVNLYSNEFEHLKKLGAIHEVQEGVGIFFLENDYYSNAFGWDNEAFKKG